MDSLRCEMILIGLVLIFLTGNFARADQILRDDDYEVSVYEQTLDHFNYRPQSYITFLQQYIVVSKYWGGPKNNSPIFVYLEGEQDLYPTIQNILTANAQEFQALLVFIEHRYYGVSQPFMGEVRDANSYGYLSSEQALADFAEIIMYLKTNFSAEHCPVIVYGGSYAGTLASWFRLKYPHIALGAWASSAPIRIQTDEYDTVATKLFRETSENCYQTIKQSWALIDELGSRPEGLAFLTQRFHICSPLDNVDGLKKLLSLMYRAAALHSSPWEDQIKPICNGIDIVPPNADILTKIFSGLNSTNTDGQRCFHVFNQTVEDLKKFPWNFQTCTEIIRPPGKSTNDTMFQSPDYLDQEMCERLFDVPQRPSWRAIEFGQDLNLSLKRFASNIIFTNGLRDPFSAGGVLENISESIIALPTANGTHSLDLFMPGSNDPDWLVDQRKTVLKIIKDWIDRYNADLGLTGDNRQ